MARSGSLTAFLGVASALLCVAAPQPAQAAPPEVQLGMQTTADLSLAHVSPRGSLLGSAAFGFSDRFSLGATFGGGIWSVGEGTGARSFDLNRVKAIHRVIDLGGGLRFELRMTEGSRGRTWLGIGTGIAVWFVDGRSAIVGDSSQASTRLLALDPVQFTCGLELDAGPVSMGPVFDARVSMAPHCSAFDPRAVPPGEHAGCHEGLRPYPFVGLGLRVVGRRGKR